MKQGHCCCLIAHNQERKHVLSSKYFLSLFFFLLPSIALKDSNDIYECSAFIWLLKPSMMGRLGEVEFSSYLTRWKSKSKILNPAEHIPIIPSDSEGDWFQDHPKFEDAQVPYIKWHFGFMYNPDSSSLDYLYLIQCKCYVKSCQFAKIQVLPFGTFWNFFFFFWNLFYPQLVESIYVEPMDMEGWLYLMNCFMP